MNPQGLLLIHMAPNSPLSQMKKVCKMTWSPYNPVFLPFSLPRSMTSMSSWLFELPMSLMVLSLHFGVDLSWRGSSHAQHTMTQGPETSQPNFEPWADLGTPEELWVLCLSLLCLSFLVPLNSPSSERRRIPWRDKAT